MREDCEGICFGARGEANLWSHASAKINSDVKARMYQEARLLCWQCPRLGICEQELSAAEAKGIHIDGIMAARFSDVEAPFGKPEFRQATCAGCGQRMRPRRYAQGSALLRHRGIVRVHAGEGLCDRCWPVMSLEACRNARAS